MSSGTPLFDSANTGNGPKILVGLVLLAVLLWLGVSERLPGPWWYEYSYAQKYHVTIDLVHCASKPNDCDWGQLPIGNKACHYNPLVVLKITQHTSMGQDMDDEMNEEEYRKATTERGRYDEPLPPKLTGVYINWVKVRDRNPITTPE